MLTIGHLFPDLLGTYGDGGNVEVLQRRMEARGHAVRVVRVGPAEPLPRDACLVVLGGGEDGAQAQLSAALSDLLAPAVADGLVVLGVCAGLQLLGHSLQLGDGTRVDGAGLLDLTTERTGRRAIGEVVATATAVALPPLTGFVNHGGATVLGPAATPLGRVRRGAANHPLSRHEGAVQGRVFGTYLHGPVLARNPALADHLLELATGVQLAPLPDREVGRLRRERLRRRPWRL